MNLIIKLIPLGAHVTLPITVNLNVKWKCLPRAATLSSRNFPFKSSTAGFKDKNMTKGPAEWRNG